jgi:hypothetical protein
VSLSARRDASCGGLSVLGSTVNDDDEEHGQVRRRKCERFEERGSARLVEVERMDLDVGRRNSVTVNTSQCLGANNAIVGRSRKQSKRQVNGAGIDGALHGQSRQERRRACDADNNGGGDGTGSEDVARRLRWQS